jgi:hypothetical protein
MEYLIRDVYFFVPDTNYLTVNNLKPEELSSGRQRKKPGNIGKAIRHDTGIFLIHFCFIFISWTWKIFNREGTMLTGFFPLSPL